MRKFLLLALPLAALMLCLGCNEEETYGSTGFTSPSSGQTASTTTTATVARPAPAPTYGRSSTTQNLPAGWGYLHEQDLTGGRLVTPGQTVRAPAATTTTTTTTTVSSTNNGS